MSVDNDTLAEPKGPQLREKAADVLLWSPSETMRISAAVGLWVLVAAGLTLNFSLLFCYFRSRGPIPSFPHVRVAVNLCVNNLLLVTAALLAALVLTFDHGEISSIVGGTQAFLAIHVVVQSWLAQVMSVFVSATAAQGPRPEKMSDGDSNIPDIWRRQTGNYCDESFSWPGAVTWRSRSSLENGEAHILGREPSHAKVSVNVSPRSPHLEPRTLKWWLLWAWVLSILSGTSLLLCSARDESKLPRTLNPFRRWYLMPSSKSDVEALDDGDVFFAQRIPLLLVILPVYLAGTIVFIWSAVRLRMVRRLWCHRQRLGLDPSSRGHLVLPPDLTTREACVANLTDPFTEEPLLPVPQANSCAFSLDVDSLEEDNGWVKESRGRESARDAEDKSALSGARTYERDDCDAAEDVAQTTGLSSSHTPSGHCFLETGGEDNMEVSKKDNSLVVEGATVSKDDNQNRSPEDIDRKINQIENIFRDVLNMSSNEMNDNSGSSARDKVVFAFADDDDSDQCTSSTGADNAEDHQHRHEVREENRQEDADLRERCSGTDSESARIFSGDHFFKGTCKHVTQEEVDIAHDDLSLNVNRNADDDRDERTRSRDRCQDHNRTYEHKQVQRSNSCDNAVSHVHFTKTDNRSDDFSEGAGQRGKEVLNASSGMTSLKSKNALDGQWLNNSLDVSFDMPAHKSNCPSNIAGQMSDRCPDVFCDNPTWESSSCEDAASNVRPQKMKCERPRRRLAIKRRKASKYSFEHDTEIVERSHKKTFGTKHATLINTENDDSFYYLTSRTETGSCKEDTGGFHLIQDRQLSKVRKSNPEQLENQKPKMPTNSFVPMLTKLSLSGLTRSHCEQKPKKQQRVGRKSSVGLLADPNVRAQAMAVLNLIHPKTVEGFDDNVNASNKRQSQRRPGLRTENERTSDTVEATSFLDEDVSANDLDTYSLSSGGDFEDKFSRWQSTCAPSHMYPGAPQDTSTSALDHRNIDSRYSPGSNALATDISSGRAREGARTGNAMTIVSSSMHHFTVQGHPTTPSQFLPVGWMSQRPLQNNQIWQPNHHQQQKQQQQRHRPLRPVFRSRNWTRTNRRQGYESAQRSAPYSRALLFPDAPRSRAEMLELQGAAMQEDLRQESRTGLRRGSAAEGSAVWNYVGAAAATVEEHGDDADGDVLPPPFVTASHDLDLSDSDLSELCGFYSPSHRSSLLSTGFGLQREALQSSLPQKMRPRSASTDYARVDELLPFSPAVPPLPEGYIFVPACTGRHISDNKRGWKEQPPLSGKSAGPQEVKDFSDNPIGAKDSDVATDSSMTDSPQKGKVMRAFRNLGGIWTQKLGRRGNRGCWYIRSNSARDDDKGEGSELVFSGVLLHVVICLPYALSLLPGLLDLAKPQDRLVALAVVQILLFFHVVVFPLWLLRRHGFVWRCI